MVPAKGGNREVAPLRARRSRAMVGCQPALELGKAHGRDFLEAMWAGTPRNPDTGYSDLPLGSIFNRVPVISIPIIMVNG
jgi:hypothetical protein